MKSSRFQLSALSMPPKEPQEESVAAWNVCQAVPRQSSAAFKLGGEARDVRQGSRDAHQIRAMHWQIKNSSTAMKLPSCAAHNRVRQVH